MAVTALTVAAERWLDQVMLLGIVANVAGAAMSESFTLPAGLGDVAILNVSVRFSQLDVGPASVITPRGVSVRIVSPDATTVVDIVGSAPILLCFDTATVLEAYAYLDPDALVLWRQTEIMTLLAPEMDSDATPTGDLQINIKCVRVRPIEAPMGQGPIQLVR